MGAAVERLAALAFLVTGLSHLLAPRAWVRLFATFAAQGEAAGIWNGLLHLPLGLVIAAFHPVWEGPGLAVTLIGWALVAKAAAQMALGRRAGGLTIPAAMPDSIRHPPSRLHQCPKEDGPRIKSGVTLNAKAGDQSKISSSHDLRRLWWRWPWSWWPRWS